MDLRDWVLAVGEQAGTDQTFKPEDGARAAFPVLQRECGEIPIYSARIQF